MPDVVDSVRVEIGFSGGPILVANVTPAGADALERAFAAGSQGTQQLDTDDGRVAVALVHVVYVKRLARDARVGFGL